MRNSRFEAKQGPRELCGPHSKPGMCRKQIPQSSSPSVQSLAGRTVILKGWCARCRVCCGQERFYGTTLLIAVHASSGTSISPEIRAFQVMHSLPSAQVVSKNFETCHDRAQAFRSRLIMESQNSLIPPRILLSGKLALQNPPTGIRKL